MSIDEIMEELETLCLKRNVEISEKRKVLYSVQLKDFFNKYNIKQTEPIIMDNYNKKIFMFPVDEIGKRYLVFDVHFVDVLTAFMCAYRGIGGINICAFLAYVLMEHNYIAGNMQKSGMFAQIFYEMYKESAKNKNGLGAFFYKRYKDEVQRDIRYISHICALHEIGHCIFKEKSNPEMEVIHTVVKDQVVELQWFDYICAKMSEDKREAKMQQVLENIDVAMYDAVQWKGIVDKYVSYGTDNGFNDNVNVDRYVEECCCDVFAALEMLKTIAGSDVKNFLFSYFWAIETIALLKIVEAGDKQDCEYIFKTVIDRVNIVSASLRRLVDGNFVEIIVREFFESSAQYVEAFTQGVAILNEVEAEDLENDIDRQKILDISLKMDIVNVVWESVLHA